MGTLVEIGHSKIDYREMQKILNEKNRVKAGKTIPAKGLFLMKVKY